MAIQKIKSIARFVKIEHTLFSLPLIFSGVFIASKNPPSLQLIILILLGATGARTAALALNRIIDRKIDKLNPRTIIRELPSGRMSLGDAVVVLITGLAIYFICAAFISTFCLMLSPIPLVIFTFYPYMKRFTSFAHFGVGLGLSMAPLGGWFAVKNSLANITPGLLLGIFTLCWVTGFDIIYSTLDEAFDRGENLYSFSSTVWEDNSASYICNAPSCRIRDPCNIIFHADSRNCRAAFSSCVRLFIVSRTKEI